MNYTPELLEMAAEMKQRMSDTHRLMSDFSPEGRKNQFDIDAEMLLAGAEAMRKVAELEAEVAAEQGRATKAEKSYWEHSDKRAAAIRENIALREKLKAAENLANAVAGRADVYTHKEVLNALAEWDRAE
jgi:hypothetical protein